MIDRAKHICSEFASFDGEDIPFDAVLFGKRHPKVSEARRVIMYVLYFENFGRSSQGKIAELFGLKRCSVNYAVKMTRERMKQEPFFANFIKTL